MRATIAASLAALALAAAAWLAASATAATQAEQRAAAFARGTCLAAIKDPAGFERIAKDHDWTRLAKESTTALTATTVFGTWETSEDGQVYLVSVAASRLQGRGQNICSVVFQNSKLARSGFFAALTAGWALAPRVDVASSGSRDEMYSVGGTWPNELVLQMTSTVSGIVMRMTIFASL